jgi:hypothetical protein
MLDRKLAHGEVMGSFQYRQAGFLITGPSPTAKTRLLSFNMTQSRFVTGQPTGHNTLRRHLYLKGLINSPLLRRFAAEEETSVHVLCESEVMASLRNAHLGSFFLDPEDDKSLNLEAIWNFSRRIGLS